MVGDTGHFKDKNIIPYRDLFPKKKKGNWKREVKKLKEAGSLLHGEFVNLQDRFDELEKWVISKSEKLMRDIEQPQQTAIDWDKPGYYNGGDGLIVISDGTSTKGGFGGFVIQQDHLYQIGHYDSSWHKDSFTPCEIDIKIKE